MKKEWEEQQIRDYLLGRLPEDETEKFDELSIADDEFALRRQNIENELMDAHLKGEISEPNLLPFETRYLAYPPRRKKIQMAKAFHSLLDKEKGKASMLSQGNSKFRFPARLAVAAIILLLLTGYLTYQNIRMQNDLTQQQAHLKAAQARQLELQKQLDEQREMRSEGVQISETWIAMNLPPATRGITKIPILEIPAGTVSAMLTLNLETNRFPGYRVELKHPAMQKILWRSETLKALGKTVSIKVPVNLFRTQHYQLELYGISANGGVEFVAGYPITVIRK